MHHHEKKAFLKFFIIYFVSVALLIFVAGLLYFSQTKNHLLKAEEFALMEYARHIKMNENIDEYTDGFHYSYHENSADMEMKSFFIMEHEFTKLIPLSHHKTYLQVFKSNQSFHRTLHELKVKIIFIQLVLLLLFAYISYKLAKNALKPLEESITTLDKFAKDLIHDLNTPVTSIKLNMKLLEKNDGFKENNALQRVKKSVQTISELHENLTILLQEETFQMEMIKVCTIVEDIVLIQKQIYPNINFIIECSNLKVKLNSRAMKQMLQNIISNACKYNLPNGYVKIYNSHNALYIENSGKTIKNLNKIFKRSYSDEQSSGIGLDIVKRLAYAMDITIDVESNENQTIFILKMA